MGRTWDQAMDRLDKAILRGDRAERELETAKMELRVAKSRLVKTIAYVSALVGKLPRDPVVKDADGQVLLPLKLEDDRSVETLLRDGDLEATLHLLREDVRVFKPSTQRTRAALLTLLNRLNEPLEESPLNPNQQRGG